MWAMRDKATAEAKRAEHREAMDKFAAKVVERRMAAPAILFLESAKPLSFLGNQALVFLQPIIQSVFAFKNYDEVAEILEDRENIEYLLRKIEELDAEQQRKLKAEKARRKEQRRAAKAEEGVDD
jgi:DNA repair photolyase